MRIRERTLNIFDNFYEVPMNLQVFVWDSPQEKKSSFKNVPYPHMDTQMLSARNIYGYDASLTEPRRRAHIHMYIASACEHHRA